MPWWCHEHEQHSMDDVCSGCTDKAQRPVTIERMLRRCKTFLAKLEKNDDWPYDLDELTKLIGEVKKSLKRLPPTAYEKKYRKDKP